MSISHLLLWLTAVIWGFAFVAQSAGMDYLGPHSFNAARFVLATLSLLPLMYFFKTKSTYSIKSLWLGGLAAGSFMFFGFSFQQSGLLYTTAGNAGFITSMYIVFVPIVGLMLGHATSRQTWLGVILALVGLYSLTVGPNLTINYGDGLELIGTAFWTLHVLTIANLSRRLPAIPLSIVQFSVASIWAIGATLLFETPTLADFNAAWFPLLYAGVASSSIACTLQILGQKNVTPSISALILSSEAVFAVLGGWLLMGEVMSMGAYIGCGFILTGMLVSQWPVSNKKAIEVSLAP